MRVGVISDTHGLLRPQVLCELKRCACIVHAGDFDREDVLRELEEIAPVYAVRGNNDWWGRDLPRTLSFELEGVRFTMAHNPPPGPGGPRRDSHVREIIFIIAKPTEKFNSFSCTFPTSFRQDFAPPV